MTNYPNVLYSVVMLMQSPEPGNDRILGNLPAGPVWREDSEKAEVEHLSVSSRATEYRKGEDGCSHLQTRKPCPPHPPAPRSFKVGSTQNPRASQSGLGLGNPDCSLNSTSDWGQRLLENILYLKAMLHRNVPGYPAFGGCGCREWELTRAETKGSNQI